MCEFGVSELQFEFVVPMDLPNFIVGCGTMTVTHESLFFFSKKQNTLDQNALKNRLKFSLNLF